MKTKSGDELNTDLVLNEGDSIHVQKSINTSESLPRVPAMFTIWLRYCTNVMNEWPIVSRPVLLSFFDLFDKWKHK